VWTRLTKKISLGVARAKPDQSRHFSDAEDAPVTKARLRATATHSITRISPVIGWNIKLSPSHSARRDHTSPYRVRYCSKDLFFWGQLDLNVNQSSPKQNFHSKSLLTNNQFGKKYTVGSESVPEMSVWSEWA
jgi:hypothetical protein